MELYRLRSYQFEMLKQSLESNIIVAMDTGSGKTQIAIMRIIEELERCPLNQIVWFLAPTVSLCGQQHDTISAQLPALKIRLLTGKDGVDRWGIPETWNSALQDVRLVISTHAVLCDALTHGFVQMKKLALIVFDEAHHCIKNHPANRIMRDFYHPTRLEEKPVPHILGLTASPIIKSSLSDLRKIESNLHAISRTPQNEREELRRYVHRPALVKIVYEADEPSYSSYLPALSDLLCRCTIGDRYLLKKFYDQACMINTDLGSWATDLFISTTIRQLMEEAEREESHAALWVDPTKTALVNRLSSILDLPASLSLTSSKSDNISDRVRLLLKFLQSEKKEHFSGIIFVRERVKAFMLAELLSQHPDTRKYFHCAPCVGESNGTGHVFQSWQRHHRTKQADLLKEFRQGQRNLIIATSVFEEGIDVRSCHVIVSFDPPANLKSFIQRRGRARHRCSKFALMVPRGSKESISEWGILEQEMIKMYADKERTLEEIETEDACSEKMPHQFPLRSGALLTGDSAISHLYHFCNTLPRERYVDLKPAFDIGRDEDSGLMQATVMLPSSVDPAIRTSRGRGWWRTKRVARQDAALNACIALHKAKLLSDNLLPVSQDALSTSPELPQIAATVQILTQQHPWQEIAQEWCSAEQHFHQTRVTFSENGIERSELTIILTSPVELPESPPLNLYWERGSSFLAAFTSLPMPEPFSRSEIKLMQEATSVLNPKIEMDQRSGLSRDYVILCTPDIPRSQLQRWVSRYRGSCKLAQYPGDRNLGELGLVRHPHLHTPHRLKRRFRDEKSLAEMLECCALPRRRNFFDHSWSAKSSAQGESVERTKIVLAEIAIIDNLPWKLARVGYFLLTILSQLWVLMSARKLQLRVIPHLRLHSLELLASAITAPSAQWTANYQRLEFLGDSFLKYATCRHLFQFQPYWHEGLLSQKKDQIISNNSLAGAAIRVGVAPLVLTEPLISRRRALALVSDEDANSDLARNIRVKIFADVVESLVGAALVSGGVDVAYKMTHMFLPQISPQANLCGSESQPSVSQMEESMRRLMDKLIGYSFRDRQIQLEALTHPSWERDMSRSYQRLEFLGDAILDIIVTRHLFRWSPELPESTMSNIRAAVVNAHFLAFLCMSFAVTDNDTRIVESRSGQFEAVTATRQVELWKFMRHHNHQITMAQKACLERYSRLRDQIHSSLAGGYQHPWALLAELDAEKFYSDIVESLLGALFIDSRGSFSRCEEFLGRLGLIGYLERVLSDHINVDHPRAVLSRLVSDKKLQFVFQQNGSNSFSLVVSIEGKPVAHVKECRSKAEAVLRASDKAVVELQKDSAKPFVGSSRI